MTCQQFHRHTFKFRGARRIHVEQLPPELLDQFVGKLLPSIIVPEGPETIKGRQQRPVGITMPTENQLTASFEAFFKIASEPFTIRSPFWLPNYLHSFQSPLGEGILSQWPTGKSIPFRFRREIRYAIRYQEERVLANSGPN
jgi:hypothetical protein